MGRLLLYGALSVGGLALVAETALRLRRHLLAPRPEERAGGSRIVCLGDSITYGFGVQAEEAYPYLLSNLLSREYPEHRPVVINAGINGQTAVQGLERLEEDVLRHRPDWVIIGFGLNDGMLARSSLDGWRERNAFLTGPEALLGRSHLYRAVRNRCLRLLRRLGLCAIESRDRGEALAPRVSPQGFKAALRRMVRRLRRGGVARVTLLTPPCPARWLGARQLDTYRHYANIIREVAGEMEAGLVDLWEAFEAREGLLIFDGLHPSAEGYRLIAGMVFEEWRRWQGKSSS